MLRGGTGTVGSVGRLPREVLGRRIPQCCARRALTGLCSHNSCNRCFSSLSRVEFARH